MEKLYEMTVPQLYRGILKMVRTYPSKNRGLFRAAIIEEVGKYKKETDPLENKKNIKRVRMIYAHLYMYKVKMEEVNSDTHDINKPFHHDSINKKTDDDFIYF